MFELGVLLCYPCFQLFQLLLGSRWLVVGNLRSPTVEEFQHRCFVALVQCGPFLVSGCVLPFHLQDGFGDRVDLVLQYPYKRGALRRPLR